MARTDLRLDHNASGDFYVDSSCIDCDTCRWMAPETFVARDGQSSVVAQPSAPDSTLRALRALISCPTSSIGTLERHDVAGAAQTLPDPITDDVLHCGYHAESSFGAASSSTTRCASR